jgi:hypothetical protein
MTRINCLRALLCIAALLSPAAWCAAGVGGGPTPTDPDNMAGGGLPGTYPTTVTAANMNVEQGTPAVLNGEGQNNLKVTFPAAGPIKWTESRHNEGDISPLIGPFDPNDPSYYPPNAFVDNYQPLSSGQPFANSTLAWRVNRATGAALATVRHNGVNHGLNYTFNGSPVGTIHGVAYMNESGSGWGFRMSDGVFANGGDGSSDLQMGLAGFNGEQSLGQGEANFNVALAYFPYEQGWIGAWVSGGDDGEAIYNASSMGLPTSAVNRTNSQAIVQLPGVNSLTDGMLFVAPTDGDNNTNIAAAFPSASGWTVSVREDDSATFDGGQDSLATGGANSFQFLYVPYSAPGLIGGHVNGSNAALINSAGDQGFSLTRRTAGEYALSINGPGPSKLDEGDGMLILSVASSMPGNPSFADRTFLSYEYETATGDFIIQSREVSATGQPSPPSQNQFGDVLSLRDSNFYFAWIDFTDPLRPVDTGIPGDYNGDGAVNAADYVVWRKNNGSQEGYDTWRTNFGRTSGSGSGALADAAVPEPAALVVCGLMLGILAMRRVR